MEEQYLQIAKRYAEGERGKRGIDKLAEMFGAPIGQRLRYLTPKATVTLTFRRRAVTVEDILAALDDVREQVRNDNNSDKSKR